MKSLDQIREANSRLTAIAAEKGKCERSIQDATAARERIVTSGRYEEPALVAEASNALTLIEMAKARIRHLETEAASLLDSLPGLCLPLRVEIDREVEALIVAAHQQFGRLALSALLELGLDGSVAESLSRHAWGHSAIAKAATSLRHLCDPNQDALTTASNCLRARGAIDAFRRHYLRGDALDLANLVKPMPSEPATTTP
jgi:hypothetical protein